MLLFTSSCLFFSCIYLKLLLYHVNLKLLLHHQSWLILARKSRLTLLEVLYHRWSCLFYISESRLLHEWRILSALTVFMSTKRKPLLAIVGVISSGRRLSINDLVIYRLVHISSSDMDEKFLLWEWMIFLDIHRTDDHYQAQSWFEVLSSQWVRASIKTS